MADPFPLCELPLIDLTVRMFTEPLLEGDQTLLRQIVNEEALNKNERLYALAVGEKELASAAKFSAILEAEGVEVAMKPGKLGPIPALAKSDPFMQELLDHDDERICDLAQARLEIKSTIDETRSARLLQCASRGPLPIYLHYCGAHTRRWSGGDASNFQNLRRTSRLRSALRAPKGYLLARPDQSNGECRFLNWFAGQADVVERFRLGHDPYLPIACKFYRREITKADAAERGTGKQLELSCGYGAGAETIVRTAARGTYGPPVKLTLEQGREARDLYRETHPKVVELWRDANYVLHELADGRVAWKWGILSVRNHRIYHPNGTWLDYSGLRWRDGEWRLYGRHGSWSKIYGAKLVENVIQWLSRIKTAEAMLQANAKGYIVCGMAHDDIWCVIPRDGNEETHRQTLASIMAETPSWAPGLPLAADCAIGHSYGG